MNDIIAPEKTAAAREAALTDTEKMIRTFARRADTPADRVAYAEMEAELKGIRERWESKGLLPPAPVAPSKAA